MANIRTFTAYIRMEQPYGHKARPKEVKTMYKREYLDRNDADFDALFNNLEQYTAKKCEGGTPEWTHIPAAALQELQEAYTVWHTAYVKTLVPHTPLETEAKNEANVQAKAKIRPFVNLYLREDQSAVTDVDRMTMGIPNEDYGKICDYATGGFFGELKGSIKKVGQYGNLEVHHMPAQSAIKEANLWNGDIGKAPAIIMDAADHAKTASFKYSKNSIAHRTMQSELIKQGRFADALQMDIDDLKNQGLYNKYKSGIYQMMKYIYALEKNSEL
ncbi:MAG: hypothetical protein LBB43_07820 [Spirochaetaceae bacterium]|jgi:hypothetical protein|nr:hypothetical protein [Spirochaetaceae bacterium]